MHFYTSNYSNNVEIEKCKKKKTKTKQNKQKGFEKSEMEIVYRHQYRVHQFAT